MTPDLEALRLRVERTELELRLLQAFIRIRRADQELLRARIRNEESMGIYRDQEPAYGGAPGSGL
jgi:hypothetical protein